MKDNQAKYPQLRFKGFTYPWEKRKLSKWFAERTERSGEGEMLSVTISSGVVRANSLDRKDNSSTDKSNYKVVHIGDIAYNSMRMWQAASGVSNYDGIVSPAYTVLVPAAEVSSVFFGYQFKQTKMKQIFQRNSQGLTSDTWNLKYPLLAKIKTSAPQKTEQVKIGTFFATLDHLIAVNQRKLAKLKELKQGYLQKLFPENGSKFPQLRFAGFADAWEQRKLSDLTESHNSGVYIPKDQYGEGTNIIGVGDIYDSDVVDGQRYRLAPVKDKRFILHTNDLLYGESSLVPEGIARVVSVSEAGAGTAFAWHTRRFKVNQVTLNSRFLGLELDYWLPARSHLMRSSTKTALTGITTQDFFNTQIVFPSKPEQEKIATLINSLDTAIALHHSFQLLSIAKRL